jgi:hypothetical protein
VAAHLGAGRRYVVRRFHSEMGQTWSPGQRLELERVDGTGLDLFREEDTPAGP